LIATDPLRPVGSTTKPRQRSGPALRPFHSPFDGDEKMMMVSIDRPNKGGLCAERPKIGIRLLLPAFSSGRFVGPGF
jgi:hypothetical protein